jgi:hypothetical protein
VVVVVVVIDAGGKGLKKESNRRVKRAKLAMLGTGRSWEIKSSGNGSKEASVKGKMKRRSGAHKLPSRRERPWRTAQGGAREGLWGHGAGGVGRGVARYRRVSRPFRFRPAAMYTVSARIVSIHTYVYRESGRAGRQRGEIKRRRGVRVSGKWGWRLAGAGAR